MEISTQQPQELTKTIENEVALTMTKESSQLLGKLLLRPNPMFSEFMFFALGENGTINEIVVANTESHHPESGIKFGLTGFGLGVSRNELIQVMQKLEREGKIDKIMVVGHSHPSGRSVHKGITLQIDPSDELLEPSMGGVLQGGPTKAKDLKFAYDLEHDAGFPHEFFGIGAATNEGPKLRIYRTKDLSKVKKSKEINSLPQQTIKL